MAEKFGTFATAAAFIARHRGLILPVAAATLIFVILVPLPPAVMDLLLAGNIALAAVILLTTIYVGSPLEFSVFPTVLLGATLLRLVLNVATTRLILTAGADGRGIQEAHFAAGRVIWSFSEFVTAGSLAVGVILFAILAVIQFVVITKGAARISEVAARFVLDAMPGRQMAIDADLNAGLITEAEARHQRQLIGRQADFYGAMDGASKFLRGDAVAAVIITMVNVGGGIYIGLVQYNWSWSPTVDLFTRLTIGDGLAMQIPALIVSISAALIVTRSAERTHLGEEIVRQLVSRPIVLVIAAVFLAVLAMTSLPKAPLLLIGAGFVALAVVLTRRQKAPQSTQLAAAPPAGAKAERAGQLEQLLAVDPIRIELGYALVGLVEAPKADLLQRIAALRRQIAGELGLLVPPIRIRDDMRLSSHSYVIKIRNAKVGAGRLYPEQLLAVGGDATTGRLHGKQTTEPAFGTPAVWIGPGEQHQAEMMNYTVVDPTSVLVTHLAEVIRRHAADLLTRQQVAGLLKGLESKAFNLVQELNEKFKTGQTQKVLQNLLRERIPIHDLEAILEAMTEYSGPADRMEPVTEHVRGALARTVSQQYSSQDGKLWCVCLDETLENTIGSHVETGQEGGVLTMPPELTRRVAQAVTDGLGRLRQQGRSPVVLCAPQIRSVLRRIIAPTSPEAAVLAYNEIDTVEVQSIATVRIES